jgi:hypothetical protein
MKKSVVINKLSNTDIIDKHTDSVQIYGYLPLSLYLYDIISLNILNDWLINQLKGL